MVYTLIKFVVCLNSVTGLLENIDSDLFQVHTGGGGGGGGGGWYTTSVVHSCRGYIVSDSCYF